MNMVEALLQQLKASGVVTFSVRARPGAQRTAIKDILADGTVKIDVAAAPEEGRANVELVTFLAEEFGVSKSCVEVISGLTSKTKIIRIRRAR